MVTVPVSGVLDVDELAVEKIYNLTSGHAYFVQLLCWALGPTATWTAIAAWVESLAG